MGKTGKAAARYAKAYRKAAQAASVPDPEASASSYERRLADMYASDLYRTHDVYPTMDTRMIYAVIAMCLELRERGVADAQIIAAVNQAFAGRKRAFVALEKLIGALPCAWTIARRWNIQDHEKRVADGSIDYDLFEVSDHAVEYRIGRCMYVEMFDAWGVRSLCQIFCDTDTQAYDNLTRHVEFVRHSTLATGDTCHDEIYERVRRPRAW